MLMRPKIKICGIKKKEEAMMLNNYPVDYIGFIFAKSKRQVSLEQAKVLRKLVRPEIKVVGVFVNEDSHRINQIADACRLDIVQLHGNEDDDFCKKITLPRWKSIGVKDPSSLEQISSYRHIDGILLDTYHKGVSGGTGKTFRWDLVKDISKEQFLILAGGLNPDNIIAAMTEVNPHVLDVNSGVETHLIKDEYKVKALFNQINRH